MKDRVLILDGAMGTMIAEAGYAGGCNEELCVTKPDVIREIHRKYLDAGADIIIANTFGATSVVLSEYGLTERAGEINRAAISCAKKACAEFSTTKRPRFVAGELGPTSKLPTLLHISFGKLFKAYEEQASALIEAGADLIIIETCQDPLQAKAAISASRSAGERLGRTIPIIASMTIERIGTMLLGTEISAALATLAPFRPMAFGLNCAIGPDDMEEYLQKIAAESQFPIICQPNAGLPENVGGKPKYPLGPEAFATSVAKLVSKFNIALVGGCCGTTPDHIRELAQAVAPIGRADATKRSTRTRVASLFSAIDLDQEPRPFIVAEQLNANGSKKFRELLAAADFDSMAEIGRVAASSSHAIDICVAMAERDERDDITELIRRLALKADAAMVIDSTNPETIEAALKISPGRPIINSINLEDGGEKAKKVLALAKKYGAVVVALTIDELGMAKDAAKKLAIAKRLLDLAAPFGLSADDLLIDPLTFTLASGDQTLIDAGVQTIKAIKMIKEELPGIRTILGVSNISFGLTPLARKALTSVFLHRALAAGLDAAIINPAKIMPYIAVATDVRKICDDLIDGNSADDPLTKLLNHYKNRATPDPDTKSATSKKLSPPEDLRGRIIDGRKDGLEALLTEIKISTTSRAIINDILLPAMGDVGVAFGAGDMPLPFVLQSAEAMRAAIDILSKDMNEDEIVNRGTIVLATVRGDVHDIGKDLVDSILSNNGFKVINLGIRQPAAAIIEAVKAHNADAIGLSGLLVSSVEAMKEDAAIFKRAGLTIPILCGGAALTQSYVLNSITPAYGSKVYYCSDAFAGLKAMEDALCR